MTSPWLGGRDSVIILATSREVAGHGTAREYCRFPQVSFRRVFVPVRRTPDRMQTSIGTLRYTDGIPNHVAQEPSFGWLWTRPPI